MQSRVHQLLSGAGLLRLEPMILRACLPAIGLIVERSSGNLSPLGSKFGGSPQLPEAFVWPNNKSKALDFLLQINLADIAMFDESNSLPIEGMLSFFYDLEEQPWGYDPDDLAGFRVIYTPSTVHLIDSKPPNPEFALPEHRIVGYRAITLPHYGSLAYEIFGKEVKWTDEEEDHYLNFVPEFEAIGRPDGYGVFHHLFGHSSNIQGDMQLEAQLVTHGLYCGDSSGYNDALTEELAKSADDWELLLQLDSDIVDWGDGGMLYFWIRKDDLSNLRFENTWMTLQCY